MCGARAPVRAENVQIEAAWTAMWMFPTLHGAVANGVVFPRQQDRRWGSTPGMARIFREHPDSCSVLAPRIFTRVFCQPGRLIATVRFYEQLTRERLDMDMDIPEAGLHVVAVGSFLILELDAEQHGWPRRPPSPS
jgi:hypothetical protein